MKACITRWGTRPNVWAALGAVGVLASGSAAPADSVVVSVKTTCEAMVPDACRGAYGFCIAEAGAFVAGPAPDGREHHGRAVETRLFSLARGVLANPVNSALACPALGPIPGTRETVTVSFDDKMLVLRGDGGIIDARCGAAASDLSELFKAADEAMRRHYPTPFH